MLQRFRKGLIVGALVLAVTAPVSAQSRNTAGAAPQATPTASGFQFNGRYAGGQPSGGVGGSVGTQMPANVSVTYPNAPWQQPGIVQNQLQMRATSPRPNEYLGGAYNPVYQSNRYPLYDYRPVYYSGYGNAYAWPGSYGYPAAGYVPTTAYIYSGNGTWAPVFAPQVPVIFPR